MDGSDMKRLLAVLILTIAGGFTAVASDDIRSIMSDISEQLFELLPALHEIDTEPEEFFDEVTELQALLEKAGPHFDNQPEGSQVTYQAVLEQIQEASTYRSSKNMMMAKHLLSQSFEMCASCHAQDQRSRRQLGVSRFHDLAEFTVAEYSYMTRDYDSALTSYRNVLTADDTAQYQRLTAMERMLTIHLEIRGDIPGALEAFTAVRGQGNEINTLNHWREALLRLSGEDAKLSPLAPKTVSDLNDYLEEDWQPIQSLLNQEEREVYWLLVRHRINEFLNTPADDAEAPILFYWLAVSDRSMYYQFYDAMSRQYLEQCVRQYPSHPFAAKCFDEYELLMIVSYSGSGGINIPDAISRELNALRRMVHEGQQPE